MPKHPTKQEPAPQQTSPFRQLSPKMQGKHAMQTRSAARKFEGFSYVGDGVYVRTEPSATGVGTHTQWLYDNYQPPTKSHSNESPESFSSLFDGSLSSLSSSDESVGSSGSFSDIPDTRSPSDSAQLFESYQNLLDFMGPNNPRPAPRQARPVTPVKNAGRSQGVNPSRHVTLATPKNNNPIPLPTTPRPLKRTAHQRWELNASGNLCPVVEKPTRFSDPEEIRERELKLLEERRKEIQASLWLGTEKDDVAMEFDAENMPFRGDSSNQNIVVASSSRIPAQPRPKKLGPHGTEIIDENFRAPAGEVSVYPESWVQNQSNGLRSYPTESCV